MRWTAQVNHAIGATSSMYHASCVTADAADADLVIVELTLNDYTGPELDITQSPSKCAPRRGQSSTFVSNFHTAVLYSAGSSPPATVPRLPPLMSTSTTAA